MNYLFWNNTRSAHLYNGQESVIILICSYKKNHDDIHTVSRYANLAWWRRLETTGDTLRLREFGLYPTKCFQLVRIPQNYNIWAIVSVARANSAYYTLTESQPQLQALAYSGIHMWTYVNELSSHKFTHSFVKPITVQFVKSSK